MKVTIDIDCTPEEARSFLGLPDVKPVQEAMMAETQRRLKATLDAMSPEALIKLWLPGSSESIDPFLKMFGSGLTGSGLTGSGPKKD